jgi:hypothetical protein
MGELLLRKRTEFIEKKLQWQTSNEGQEKKAPFSSGKGWQIVKPAEDNGTAYNLDSNKSYK